MPTLTQHPSPKHPNQGGQYTRDPNTGKITKVKITFDKGKAPRTDTKNPASKKEA